MKRALPAVIIVSSMVSGVLAKQSTFTLEVDLTQRYMWRGLDLLDGTAAVQPSLTSYSTNGWYLGAWGSLSLDRSSSCREISGDVCRQWDEINLYVGIAGELAPESRLASRWDLGFTYFNFPHQPRKADTVELAVEVSHPRVFGEAPFMPHWAVYYNQGATHRGDQGGWLIAGVGGTFHLGMLPVDVAADVTWKCGDAGLWSYTGFSHANLRLATDFSFQGWTLIPGLNLQKSFVDDREGIHPEDQVWVNLVLSRDF